MKFSFKNRTYLVLLMLCFGMFVSSIKPTITVMAQTDRRGMRVQPSDQTVTQWPETAKRWALIIGVGEYKDKHIPSVAGAVNDARKLADTLENYAGFPQSQIILLTTDDENQPTQQNILRAFEKIKSMVKDGLLMVAFSGHGMERNDHVFLIPSDAMLTGDVARLEKEAISLTRLKNLVKEAGVGQLVMLIDACRNDPTAKALDSGDKFMPTFIREGRFNEVHAYAVIYATSEKQVAYDDLKILQGYFSAAVVEALEGKATPPKQDKEITLSELIEYVQREVPKRVPLGKEQKPLAVIEGYEPKKLVIAVVRSKEGERTEPAVCKGSTSEEMIKQSWAGLTAKQFEPVLACSGLAIKKWTKQADEQQIKAQQKKDKCEDTPDPSQLKEYFAGNWALSDIAVGWFIRGEVFSSQGRFKEAKNAYKTVIEKYGCAFAWDPRGWFWRVADGAKEKYEEINK